MIKIISIIKSTKITLLFSLLFCITLSFAQENNSNDIVNNTSTKEKISSKKQKKIARKARKALRKKEYIEAKTYYDKLTKANTQNPEYWYEAGKTYFDSEINKLEALPKLKKSLSLYTNNINPDLFLYLGDAEHYNSNFEKAISFYNQYRNAITSEKNHQELEIIANRKIEISNNGIDLRNKKAEKEIILKNMGESINSSAGDYSPVLSSDGNLLLFCTRRPPNNRNTADGQYFEDIFYTTKVDGKWKEAVVIDKNSGYLSDELNRGKRHEAPISLSPDGNSLFIYTENSVWRTNKDDKNQWSNPRRMNQNVNIGNHTPSVFITPDGKEIFIVSNGAEGGLGQRDIYRSIMLEDGTWDTPVNLGPKINTKYNEDAPFITKDGKTLYFASEGHNSMGGYDIFKTTKDENGEWKEPMNIGSH